MRPYFVKVIREEPTDSEPIYLANVPELEGCFGQGETPEDAIVDLQSALADYIASLLEEGLPVPNPTELAATTSSTVSETVVVKHYSTDKNIVHSPQSNIYIPAG